jgi:cytochrome b6-f complex iron-sulfur subunit
MSDPRPDLWGRRDLVTATGWAAVSLTALGSVGAFFRLLFRRAPVRPPSVFQAGAPGDFRPGTVSDRFLEEWRVYIVRQQDTVFAVYAKCSHLGCTPKWKRQADKFKCPCHGSGFTAEGINFEGPAPRPLDRAKVWLDRNGELVVDVGRRFPHTEWHHGDASVTVPGTVG